MSGHVATQLDYKAYAVNVHMSVMRDAGNAANRCAQSGSSDGWVCGMLYAAAWARNQAVQYAFSNVPIEPKSVP